MSNAVRPVPTQVLWLALAALVATASGCGLCGGPYGECPGGTDVPPTPRAFAIGTTSDYLPEQEVTGVASASSDHPEIATFAWATDRVRVKALQVGTAQMTLRDHAGTTLYSATIQVVRPDTVELHKSWADGATLLEGTSVSFCVRPMFKSLPVTGTGFAQVTATGAVDVAQKSASTFTGCDGFDAYALTALEPGAGAVTVTAGSITVTTQLAVVAPSDLSSIAFNTDHFQARIELPAADPATVALSNTSLGVTIDAGKHPVVGARCRWESAPAGLVLTAPDSPDEEAETTSYSVGSVGGKTGDFTITCLVDGDRLTSSVPATLR